MNRYITLLLIFLTSGILLSNESFAAEKGWQDLFDGKTLKGWIQRNGKAQYAVEDGMIVGTTVLNTPNSFLCTEKMYTDFVVELEFLAEPGMNSGIQIRSRSFEHFKDHRVHGYQVEIDTSDRAWSGGIYDEARRGWLYPLKDKPEAQKAFKQNQWNHYRIEANGDRIRTWVNGVPAADLQDDMTSTGFIALQVHASKEAGKRIKWRNIRIQDVTRQQSKGPLKALIVDGQNNHDWKGTTPVLKSLLQKTGLFVVEVATSPDKGQPMDSFRPDFAKYDVIVSNYNGDDWPKETQDALVKYMQNGGGLVIYHAADNAFPKWNQWNEMIALGGWGGRNEKSGPKVRYRDGKVVFDKSPGRGGSHGPQHEFQVIIRDRLHAITAGLPEKWMHASDELYSELRGPAKNMTILATAFAEPAQKGTGEHEPMLFTVRHGKSREGSLAGGRVFHTVLGHGPEQLCCVGFIVTFQRGTEWAATGRVTQVEVPADFPTPEKVSLRSSLSAPYEAIENYDFGASRRALAAIEEEIRNVPPSSFPQVEARLLKVLQSAKTKFAGKQFVCRMLRRVGSAKSVPALSERLADKELSHIARFALQHMPAPEAGAALRKALSSLDGDLRIGVIGSVAQRRDRQAVSQIAQLINSADPATAAAAIQALGRIGGSQATDALSRAKVPESLKDARDDAYLLCADSVLAEGQSKEAVVIYRQMAAPANSTWIRIAAYKGLVQAEKADAVPHVLALLKDPDLDLQRAAGKFIVEMPGPAITKALGEQLGQLGADAQVVLLGALEGRGDKAAAPCVAALAGGTNEPVRIAAIEALAVLGDASSVELLAKISAENSGAGRAAMTSLGRLSCPGVAGVLAAVARSDAAVAIRVKAIQALVNRRETEAIEVLLAVTKDTNPDVRQAAYKALGELAGPGEFANMVSMLMAAPDAGDRAGIERALIAMAARLEAPDAASVIAGLAKASDTVKPDLLAVLAHFGGKDALDAVRSQLGANDAKLKSAAIRALAAWPDASPLSDLMNIARNESDATCQVLALRGCIQLLDIPANRVTSQTVGSLAEVMSAARGTEEKKAVLSALVRYPCEEAVELAESAKKDGTLAAEAELALKEIKKALVSQKTEDGKQKTEDP